jgi:hypothetical protein
MTSPPLIEEPVFISQETRQIRVKIRATETPMAGGALVFDPVLYPKLHPMHKFRDLDNANTEVLTVSAAAGAPANYSVDVGVPILQDKTTTIYRGFMPYLFTLHGYFAIDSTNTTSAAVAITSAAENWIEPGGALGGFGDIGSSMHFSATTLDHKIITGYNPGFGANGRYYLDGNWDETPTPGATTLTVRESMGVRLYTVSLYELAVTDFSASYGVAE